MHTDVIPAIAPTASTELARLLDQFIRQAIPSQVVSPTKQPSAPLSLASIDVTLPMLQPQTKLHPYVQQGQPQQGQPMMQPQRQEQPLVQPQQGQPLMQPQQGQPLIQQPLIQQPLLQQQAPPQQQSHLLMQPLQQPQQLQPLQNTSQQLPVPVPTQLQQQILRGEYADFAVLHDKTSFVDTARTTQYKPPPVSSFPLWMQAWRGTHMLQLCSHITLHMPLSWLATSELSPLLAYPSPCMLGLSMMGNSAPWLPATLISGEINDIPTCGIKQ